MVCRVATILKTRYTSPGFWNTGLQLFHDAEQLVSSAAEKKHFQSCIAQAKEQLAETENLPDDSRLTQNRTSGGAWASEISHIIDLLPIAICYIGVPLF